MGNVQVIFAIVAFLFSYSIYQLIIRSHMCNVGVCTGVFLFLAKLIISLNKYRRAVCLFCI
jgi:hypothetical protein